ncbi:MAG: HAD hydrolase family protein [Gemmataceae bacterium]|nr:HAD hydrolase family protein [Gemmataceae bacterium]
MELAERCRPIELLLLDVDGVLTDGRIIYTERGDEIKEFHVRDGSGLKQWVRLGKKSGIVTGRRSELVQRRAAELDMAVCIQGCAEKRSAVERILSELGLRPEQAAFMGDDFVDLGAMDLVGLAIAPADASDDVLAAAHLVTAAPGGRGAVREAIELMLRVQGIWAETLAKHRRGGGQDPAIVP